VNFSALTSTDKNLEGYHGEDGEGEDNRHEVARPQDSGRI
jgi:hypothetical protein